MPGQESPITKLALVFAIALATTAHACLTAASISDKVIYREIQSVLDHHCVKCHGRQRQEGGLRLDSSIGIHRGSDNGPIIITNNPDKSRLVQAIRGVLPATARMPAKAPALPEALISRLVQWIRSGAIMPLDEIEEPIDSTHWAFQTPQAPSLPNVREQSGPLNPIDHFVLSRLEEKGLRPSPQAPKATLARRVALDLTGVPLRPEELKSYMADPSPNAYEKLVDSLLASPHYGERWGRHWLDQARYADSNGFTRDFAREIWKYRDWVIDSINQNIPFDQFTIEQIAGDMLPSATLEQRLATGFHRNTLINEEGGTDPEQFRVDAIADRVATTGSVFMGLTLGCARCHPHKFDPISQREYFQIFALFNNCDEPKIDAPSLAQQIRGEVQQRDLIRSRIKKLDESLHALGEVFLQAQYQWEQTITPEYRATLLGPIQASLDLKPDKRTPEQQQLVKNLFKETEAARDQFAQIDETHRLRQREPTIPTSLVVKERPEPRKTFVHKRGNFLDHGPSVQPGTPQVLPPLKGETQIPNRLDFARWLVTDKNPLTARVTVNRYWLRFFGQGLVQTDNDFGTQGEPPSHPELLDWLAMEFINSGWNSKYLHRLIVTSATYRQSSRFRPDLKRYDPANQWLARQSRVRLDAEIIRDASLAVSGQLTPIIGGPSVYPPQPEGVFEFTQDPKPWPTATGEDRFRRGLYTYLWRSIPYPALVMFDAPDGNITCTQRNRSNTPMQALTLANDIQFIECAQEIAARVLSETSLSEPERIDELYIRCLSRLPTENERQALIQLLDEETNQDHGTPQDIESFIGPKLSAMSEDHHQAIGMVFAARVLLNTDEFITRE